MALFQKDVNPIPAKPSVKPGAPKLHGLPSSNTAVERPDTSKAEINSPSESRLTVGPNIKLRGVEIEDCDTLVVEGYVEAAMDSRVIEISEKGVYKGKVEIDIAVVRGRFEGELTARERLIVHESGDVSGTIRYGRLAIEEGGRVHGDLDELKAVPSARAATASETKPKEPDAPSTEDAA